MDATEEIKSRLSIEEVVGRQVDLKRSGSAYKGLCPFHQEKTPSFYVSPARGTYHCFGCGKHGDIFTFVMETERLPFPDALGRLADQAGVALPERSEQKGPSLKSRLLEINGVAAESFHKTLQTAQGKRAVDYLRERGFGPDAIDQFELGYAAEGRETLTGHLRRQGFDDRIILAAGLGLQDDVGGKAFDRFRGRLMFPIRDAAGRVLGFGGRALGEVQPKYLNSPQTEVFDKSSVLYGIHRAQDAIRQGGRAVLVEGYLDAVRAHVGGFPFTVASLGTSVTGMQLSTLNRYTDTVILALDPDPAGQAAAARTALNALAELTERKGRTTGSAGALDLRVARLPPGTGDPDELIRDDPAVWEQALADSVPAFDFYFEQTMAGLDRSSDTWRQEAIDKLLPPIQRFGSSAGWQALWLQRLAAETGIDPRALQRSIPSARPSTSRRRERKPERGEEVLASTTARALAADPVLGVEEGLLGLLLAMVVVPDEAADLLSDMRFKDEGHQTILEHLLLWRENRNYDYEILRENLPEKVQEIADRLRGLEVPLPEEGKFSVAVAYHLARRRHLELQSRLSSSSQLLADLAPDDRKSAMSELAELMSDRRQIEEVLDRLSKLVVQAVPTGDG